MNYRHAFHAGNFADVLKHAIFCLILEHLKKKDAPFRAIDTHAGGGLYDLSGPEAGRTGEWREGIGRLWGEEAGTALAPYFKALECWNPDGQLKLYPGSPALAAALLRGCDRLTACELRPGEAGRLKALLARDRRAKALAIDGWRALGAFVPPKERRGVVLVDPPFEAAGEFERLADNFLNAARRWASGCYLLWYPVKDVGQVSRFLSRIAEGGGPKTLRAELWVRSPGGAAGLIGAGCLVANPPFTLEADLSSLGPGLCAQLARDRGARFILDWPAPERAAGRRNAGKPFL